MDKTVETAKHSVVERWGGYEAILAEGFVPVPRVFLRFAEKVLTPAETLFVIQLMSWKWDASAPFPGYGAIAERMGLSVAYTRKIARSLGLSVAYTRKIARSLEGKNLLRRQVRRGQTNLFDLTPLFRRLVAQVDDLYPF